MRSRLGGHHEPGALCFPQTRDGAGRGNMTYVESPPDTGKDLEIPGYGLALGLGRNPPHAQPSRHALEDGSTRGAMAIFAMIGDHDLGLAGCLQYLGQKLRRSDG